VLAHDGQTAIPLRDGDKTLGTLLVPAKLPKPMGQCVHRLGSSLEALLAAARDREAIHAELEASRKELERFFDITSDVFFIGDDSHIRRVNPAAERIFGYPMAEIQGRPYTELVHPDDRDRTHSLMDALAQSGGTAQFENRCVRAYGGVRWLEWSIVA